MKNRRDLWLTALHELGEQLSVSTTAQDEKYVLNRVKREGDSFFTVTLPTFAKELEKALSDECILPGAFQGFKRRPSELRIYAESGRLIDVRKGHRMGVPEFLGGFLDLVFTPGIARSFLHSTIVRDERGIPVVNDNGDDTYVHTLVEECGDELRYLADWNEEGVNHTLKYIWPELRTSGYSDGDVVSYSDLWVAEAIRAIRQLCLMFSKEKLLCSDTKVAEAVSQFLETDGELELPL